MIWFDNDLSQFEFLQKEKKTEFKIWYRIVNYNVRGCFRLERWKRVIFGDFLEEKQIVNESFQNFGYILTRIWTVIFWQRNRQLVSLELEVYFYIHVYAVKICINIKLLITGKRLAAFEYRIVGKILLEDESTFMAGKLEKEETE